MERLLDHDSVSGVTEWFSTPDDGDTWRIRYEQDTQPFTDLNKSQQADGWDRRSDMWHAARIPIVVMMRWLTEHGVDVFNPDHKEGVRKLLNDPEYRYLRVNHFII